MKRHHPNNPNLFWCPHCETYKTDDEFYHFKKIGKITIWSYCKNCSYRMKRKWEKENPEKAKEAYLRSGKRYRGTTNGKKMQEERRKRFRTLNPEKTLEYKRKATRELSDSYVKEVLKWENRIYRSNYISQPIEIALKRQQIIAKRTLREFKQWRKEREDESNYADVYGKQFTDEKDYEGQLQNGRNRSLPERV